MGTSVALANNLTTNRIWNRGGSASLTTNLEYAPVNLFADIASGDLHLVDSTSIPVDAGTPLTTGLADTDVDGQQRDAHPDLGADEYGHSIFMDGFESGDTLVWSNSRSFTRRK